MTFKNILCMFSADLIPFCKQMLWLTRRNIQHVLKITIMQKNIYLKDTCHQTHPSTTYHHLKVQSMHSLYFWHKRKKRVKTCKPRIEKLVISLWLLVEILIKFLRISVLHWHTSVMWYLLDVHVINSCMFIFIFCCEILAKFYQENSDNTLYEKIFALRHRWWPWRWAHILPLYK